MLRRRTVKRARRVYLLVMLILLVLVLVFILDRDSVPSDSDETENTTILPVPRAFSQSRFYGDIRILNYRWYFKPREDRVSPLDYGFLDGSAKACASDERLQLVILVLTIHDMASQRQAIRDTWGSVSVLGTWPNTNEQFHIKLLFVIGVAKHDSLNTAVAKEADEKGDVILADVVDSYFNLTRKVLMGFKWIRQFCPAVKYVMKVDEDTYVDIPQLVAVINSGTWHNLIYGKHFLKDRVHREGRFKVSEEAYPVPVYPPHVKGNMYLMPSDVAMKILAVSEHMPYVNIEDVHITGILAKIFDIRHVGLPGWKYNTYLAANPCELATGVKIVSQKMFRNRLYAVWEIVKDPALC
ncbi:beta-1,3-galactosyltransferase 5-like [Gigantopelta aegis]|uniref:beta-1,3-galactosyltransferase 5-like n=1 Tax=Gigantopelta aegis TaxID=1735272 RepID=UPI001B88BD18|nr:beta-1,3-galactosyltransferase 5-like [Gigantopelta aegis]